jgi:hypothetical protein
VTLSLCKNLKRNAIKTTTNYYGSRKRKAVKVFTANRVSSETSFDSKQPKMESNFLTYTKKEENEPKKERKRNSVKL